MVTKILDVNGHEANGINGRFRFTWKDVLTWLIAFGIAWSTVTTRVAVLESRQDGIERRLDRMETKIDVLLDRP